MRTRITNRAARIERLERRSLRSAGTVVGTVFDDANGNGTRDRADAGQAGQTVWADLNANGVPDAGEPTAVTAADGSYTLRGVPAGAVTIRQRQGVGLRETYPYDGAGHPAVVRAGAATAGVNFGATTNLYVAGTVYADRNGDGTREPGEPPLAGVRVYAIPGGGGGNDEPYQPGDPTAVTGHDGAFHFDALPPTTGWVAFGVVPPAGYGLPVRTYAQSWFVFPTANPDGAVDAGVPFGLAPLVGSVAVSGDTLTVTGTAAADTIAFGSDGDGPTFAALVTIDGAGRRVDASAVTRLVIDAGGGNDRVDFTTLPGTPAGLATTVLGGAGDDTINVNPVNDPTATVFVSGGGGDDTITVGGGTAVADGDAGNDHLFAAGSAGRATLDGGAGDDTLASGVASEFVTFVGGPGTDTAAVTAANYIGSYPATGPTTLALDGRPHAGSDLVFDPDVENLTGSWPVAVNVVGDAAANRLDVRADGPETVAGGGGDDTLVAAGGGPATLLGGGGNDVLYAADGNRTVLDGGAGTNAAFADAGDVVTHAEAVRSPAGALPGVPLGSDPAVLAALDGDANTFYAGGGPVGLDLGTDRVITAVGYAPRPGWTARMVGGVFQGSEDPTFGTNVTTLYTVTTPPPAG